MLGSADEEGEAAGGSDQGGGDGEDGREALNGADCDDVECGGRKGFGAGVLYIDVGQCKGASDLAQKGGLLVVGLDQGEGDVWGPEFDGRPGKPAPEPRSATRSLVVGRWSLATASGAKAPTPFASPTRP